MDIIQDAISRNRHICAYKFAKEQTWDTFRREASGRDVYLYGLGNAAGYFAEKYSETVRICGVIDNYVNLQGFCMGDYLPEAVETPYERIPIYDAGLLKSLPAEKTIILISNINAYEEIAEQTAAFGLESFALLLLEADQRLHVKPGDDKRQEMSKPQSLPQRKSAYARKCCSLPVAENKIVFMIGTYGGHARAITRTLGRKGLIRGKRGSKEESGEYGGLDIVWLVEDLRTELPTGVRPVLISNWKRYLYEMETARIWVFDILVPEYVRKREEQIYIQTKHWPSITLKKFYLDDPSTTGTEDARELVKRNGKSADYFFVGSDFDLRTCKSGFACDGAFVFTGSPRTDVLFDRDSRNKIYTKYHIAEEIHTLLYAPTFRYDQAQRKKTAVQGLDVKRLPDRLEQHFGGKWKILCKEHPSLRSTGVREADDRENTKDDRHTDKRVIDVSGHDDSQELVAACDLLLTDYSSILFEAAFVGKPVFLFAPDRKRYLTEERELYLDYAALPFPAAETNEALGTVIAEFDYDEYRQKVALFTKRYGVHEDGQAGERAAAFMHSLLSYRSKITIVIPVYNTAACLPRCLESVMNQTYRNIEIILVDDGSTDDSLRICEEYAKRDARIVLISQENGGNTAARKRGLMSGTGEYVMFVDSDDWIGQDLAMLLYRQAEENAADLVISDVHMTRVGGREVERNNLIAAGVYRHPKEAVKKLFFDYEDCRYGILPYLFAKLYRRDLVVRAMEEIDDRIRYDEDRALVWTCLMQNITAVFTQCREYHYCQREEGLVRARDEMYLAKINYFYCYMRRLFAQEDEILRKQLERYVIWNVEIAFRWKLGMSEEAYPKALPNSQGRLRAGVSGRKEAVDNPIKVSVIIPSLNAEPYIRQCLDSVRTQTLAEIEILCVDAGSTDQTAVIIQEYAALDNRIRYRKSPRQSYGYQVNLGMDAARGEYIGIVEPDDYVTEEMFEKLYCAAHDNELDYVKSNFYQFLDYRGRRHYRKWERSYWGKPDDVFHKVIRLKETPQALVYGDHGNIWSGIYRRAFLEEQKIRFHETPGASYQDTGFAILCTLEAERVMFLDDCLYRYRQHCEGASVRSQDKHSQIIAEYAWIWEQMQYRGYTDEVCRSFYMAMKFHSYLWNYNRLQKEGRGRFLAGLAQDEMLEFREESIGFRIPEKERMLRLWQGDWSEVEACNAAQEKRRRNTAELLNLLEKAAQIVVVCAGEWGRSLLKLYGKLGTENICAVCDNAPAIQGRSVEGLEVVSVERAVREYPDAWFVIAGKYHGEELLEQLRNLGIDAARIYRCREEAYTGDNLLKFLLAR